MTRFPAFAALAFALTTLCACDPYQVIAPQSEALPHMQKSTANDWSTPQAENQCSIYPGNDKRCSPPEEPNENDIQMPGQD